jgi:dienelactone hydrolase
MTEVVLFHHVQGLTDGVLDFAEQLRSSGHTVHTPDLFGARPAATLQEGLAVIQRIGSEVLRRRVDEAVTALPETVVYAGISWGASVAQRLAQTRPGAVGALLYEACIPITGEGAMGPWPDDVAVQVHGMDADEFFALEGDLDAARALVAAVGPDRGEVFTYPGGRHLFTDSSLPSFDAGATALVLHRSRVFLDRVG